MKQQGHESDVHALTFFVSAAQRRRILRRLRALDPDRVTALCRALRVSADGTGAEGARGDAPAEQ